MDKLVSSVDKPIKRKNVRTILSRLKETYPDATCALRYRNRWELLVATILSAQCTDKRVNDVTETLFRKYPDIHAFAMADLEALQEDIRSTGFFRNKAKNLIGAAQRILKEHGGEIPASMTELIALPGVGRKTANVLLGNGYGIAGMVVDTHVKRIAMRLGWTRQVDPEKIEMDLCKLIPEEDWVMTGHMLIAHGRAICKALVPVCSECPLLELCPRVRVERAR